MIHEIKVEAYRLCPDVVEAGTGGSYGMEQLKLFFSEEWKELSKTITFYPPRRRPVGLVLTDDAPFDIPAEATGRSGRVPFSVLGIREGKRIFSLSGTLVVEATKNEEGEPVAEPTPSEAEQILSYLADIRQQIEDGKLKGEDGLTPYVGANGNWFIGDEDTGRPSRGESFTFDELSEEQKEELKGEKGDKGERGFQGYPGDSIYVSTVFESDEDGGENVITFSDGFSMRVKNGSKGSKGDTGDYSPLIVTGSPKCNAIMMGGTTNYAIYSAPLLSHTVEEIYNAFTAGRDVYIRLTNENPSMTGLGTSTVLPDIRYIEARVVSVTKDVMYFNGYFKAQGCGYGIDNNSMYSVTVSGNGSSTYTQVECYLYKAYDIKKYPLIVTGTFPIQWTNSPMGAVGSITGLLSHTLDEIGQAFNAGREVRIRFTNSDSSYTFGDWNLRYAELILSRFEGNAPTPGYYTLYASGMGYAINRQYGYAEITPMQINVNMSSTILLSTPVKSFAVQQLTNSVLDALPTWEGGSY